MSEFTATNHYVTNGNGKNGRVVPVNNGNNGAYNGKHLQNQPSTYPVEDEEDEFEDRGHWGSKAEFILSCIGFSVSQTLMISRSLLCVLVIQIMKPKNER